MDFRCVKVCLSWITLCLSACTDEAKPASAGGIPALVAGSSGTSGSNAVAQGGTSASSETLLQGGTSASSETLPNAGAAGAMSLGGAATSQSSPTGCGGSSSMGEVSPAELKAELDQATRSFLLINVHIPVNGHLPGSDKDIAYTDIAALEQFIGADKSKPVVLYCMSDHMSKIAGPQLVADGYCNVREVTGGLSAWRAAGYPVDP